MTARTLSSKWDTSVIPSHTELERLCSEAAATATGDEGPGTAAAQAAEEEESVAEQARLAFGSCVYFVQRSPAVVEATVAACAMPSAADSSASPAQASAVLSATVRLLLSRTLFTKVMSVVR